MPFTPSPEQEAIFDAVLSTNDNIAVSALAGTGKTTTLVELAKKLPKKGSKRLFCAFNKSIVDELTERLKGTGMAAKTFHGIGNGALIKHFGGKQPKIEGTKYKRIVQDWLALPDATNWEGRATERELALRVRELVTEAVKALPPADRGDRASEIQKEFMGLMTGLLNFLRLKLVDWVDETGLRDLVDHYNLEETLPSDFVDVAIIIAPSIMRTAEARVKELQEIDFTDMIYWVVKWNLPVAQNDWVFVDEAQDLSPMQRALVARTLAPSGRIVIVGDPNQAIYEFAGADSDSFDLSVQQFNAKVLPLTVTRRCAKVVTHHAAHTVKEFKCADDKPRGKYVWWMQERLTSALEKGDMVLCRMKAPLISTCLDLIAAGKPATILGSDIGKALIAILEKLTGRKDYTSFEVIEDVLDAYEDEQVAHYTGRDEPAMAEAAQDQCAAIRTLIDRANADFFEELTAFIESLFSGDSNKDVILLTTVHKSKGLEAERVFILAPDRLPLNYPNMRPESAQQEVNLYYVAVTRPKTTLVIVTNEKYRKDRVMPTYAQTDFDDHQWDADEFTPKPPQEFDYVYNSAHDDFDLVPISPTGENIAPLPFEGAFTLPHDSDPTLKALRHLLTEAGEVAKPYHIETSSGDGEPGFYLVSDEAEVDIDLGSGDEAVEALKVELAKLAAPPAPVVIAPVPEKADKLRAVVKLLSDDELDEMISYLTMFREERRKVTA